MTSIAFWLTVLFACMAAYQSVIGLWFCLLLLRSRTSHRSDIRWPRVAVLMSLRGADPQLKLSLQRILEQDYPQYKLHVVVDSSTDSAHPIVEQAAKVFGEKLDLSVLTERRTTCGLQCSAFVQAYQRIADDVEVLVTVDGDLMPHPTWLKDLVAPLLEPDIGASFGNRWFTPYVPTYGGLVRYLWNSAAVVPMAMLSIPWGGCFAIRRNAFDQTALAEKWSKAIVHDAPAMHCLRELGLKIKFVPNLMMPIRDNCNLTFCMDFIKRQMTWTRIYHSGWEPILIHAFVTTAIWLLAIILTLYGVMLQDWETAAMAGTSLVGYSLLMLTIAGLLEYAVRMTLIRRREKTHWLTWKTLVKLPIALVLAQAAHFVAVLRANSIRQVTWRGVTYLLRGPWDITLQSDRPFQQSTGDVSL